MISDAQIVVTDAITFTVTERPAPTKPHHPIGASPNSLIRLGFPLLRSV